MNRAELMYKWGLFKHYRRLHGIRLALKYTFGNYYVMPVDHEPTQEERHWNEMSRLERRFGSDNYGR